jgi:hypothetical protein
MTEQARGRQMANALSGDEYLATFAEPMRRLDADETYKPVPLGEYVAGCVRGFRPRVTREQLEIRHVYLNGNQSFYHVLIHYGPPGRFLVVVVDCNREVVHGHYLLDLNGVWLG